MLNKRTIPQQIFTYSMLVLLAIVIIFPIYFMVMISLKSSKDIYRTPSLLPVNANLKNYEDLFVKEEFLVNIKNSLIVSGGATFVSVIFSCMAAYSLVRLRYLFRDWLGRLILFTYLTPSALLFIPLSVIIARLQLSNTLHGLIFVYLTFSAPLSTWLMMGYFRGIPVDLEEQAMVDGATRLQAFLSITIPLAIPGLIAVSVFTFTAAWNELLFGLIFTTKQSLYTVPVSISYLITGDVFRFGLIMASSVAAAVPVMILYFAVQRFVVQGLTAGAVKG